MVTIAVIDDNRETVGFLRRAIQDRGWEMMVCMDGDTAAISLEQRRPDLIMLDLWLDRRDQGWEVLTQLRANPATASIPIILCSALRDELVEHRAQLDEQVDAVLVKPFSLDDLYACLDHVLSEAAGGRGLLGTRASV